VLVCRSRVAARLGRWPAACGGAVALVRAGPWVLVVRDMPGGSRCSGVGVGLKGACPAKPSNAVPTPHIRQVLSVDGVSGGSRLAHQVVGVDAHKRWVTVAAGDGVGGQLACPRPLGISAATGRGFIEEQWRQRFRCPAFVVCSVPSAMQRTLRCGPRIAEASYPRRQQTRSF
jgi:hypothetical protein